MLGVGGCRLRWTLPDRDIGLRIVLEEEIEQDRLGQTGAFDDDDTHGTTDARPDGVPLATVDTRIADGPGFDARDVEGLGVDEPPGGLRVTQ